MTVVDAAEPAVAVQGTPGHPRPVTPLGLVAAELADVLTRLDGWLDAQPAGVPVDPAIRDGLVRAHALAAGLDPYLERNAGSESPALRALAERTAAYDWSTHGGQAFLEQEMLSGHVEGRLLQMLVRVAGARNVLEVGMFTGYSALALAEALPCDGRVVACEIDAGAASLARSCFAASPAGGRIEVRVGPARDTLADLAAAGEIFDLAFIDADKAGYSDYLRTILDCGLLAPGGLICVDNTLMQGEPWTGGTRTANGAAIAAFNAEVAGDPDLEQVVVPLRDGLTLIRRVRD